MNLFIVSSSVIVSFIRGVDLAFLLVWKQPSPSNIPTTHPKSKLSTEVMLETLHKQKNVFDRLTGTKKFITQGHVQHLTEEICA